MKYPTEANFDVSVEQFGVRVTFRLAGAEDTQRHGPVSLSSVRHAGKSGDTADYIASEVQEMAVCLATSAAPKSNRTKLA